MPSSLIVILNNWSWRIKTGREIMTHLAELFLLTLRYQGQRIEWLYQFTKLGSNRIRLKFKTLDCHCSVHPIMLYYFHNCDLFQSPLALTGAFVLSTHCIFWVLLWSCWVWKTDKTDHSMSQDWNSVLVDHCGSHGELEYPALPSNKEESPNEEAELLLHQAVMK